MNDLELRVTQLLARKADEVDVRPVDGFAEAPYPSAWAPNDLEPAGATSAPSRLRRRVAQGVLAAAVAAVVVLIAQVAARDEDPPADQPSPTVAVPPRALPNRRSWEPFEPGTYYLDEVNGTPTPRIFATLDSGWMDPDAGGWWAIAKGGMPDDGGIGSMTITNPVTVFFDACHPTRGFYRGPVTTVDGFVTALREQQGGWVDVTAPSDISVDGYRGKAFQRTAPAGMSDCTTTYGQPPTGNAIFPSWESADGINGGYAPGQIETLWVLDIDGTVVVISTELWPGPSATDHADFADDVLDSIRIERS